MTNAPYYAFDSSDFTKDTMWNKLKAADDENFVMTVGTPEGPDYEVCSFNLACNHAFTLISTHIITKAITDIDQSPIKLYKIRNPYRTDDGFSG